jgi:hypothetical protein
MRTVSGHVFPVKTCVGSGVGFVGSSFRRLHEAGLTQAAVASEDAAIPTEDRSRGEGRKLIASVGFVEGPVRNAEPAAALHALVQVALVCDAANDEMRMG